MHMQTNRCRVFARQIARDRTTRLNTRLIESSSRGVAVGQSLEAIHRLEPHLRAPVVRALQRLRHVERRSQPCRRRTADPSLDLNRREHVDWGWIKCEQLLWTHRFDDSRRSILSETVALLPTHLLQQLVSLVRLGDRPTVIEIKSKQSLARRSTRQNNRHAQTQQCRRMVG